MSEICMVAPTVDAKALGAAGTCQVDARDCASVTISAAGATGDSPISLDGAEEVDIYKAVGGQFIVASATDGTAYKLTATCQMVTLEGGNIYAVAKDATSLRTIGVYANKRLA